MQSKKETNIQKQRKLNPNLQLDVHGRLSVHLTEHEKQTIPASDRVALYRLQLQHPEALVASCEERRVLKRVLANPMWRIAPNVRVAVERALANTVQMVAPVTPPTDYELIAYCDENPELVTTKSATCLGLTPGRRYPVTVQTFRTEEEFIKKKAEYNELTDTWQVVDHECTRHATDREVFITTPSGVKYLFRPAGTFDPLNPPPPFTRGCVFTDDRLWEFFERPVIPTVKEVFPDRYAHAINTMEMHEVLAAFDYYPGQKDYIARVSCKDNGIPAAETGVGKTLVAISLMVIKDARRILVMAPKATVKGDKSQAGYSAAQWEEEIRRFAPFYKVHHLFEHKDLLRLMEGGALPEGVYITYPEAFLTNGARENMPDKWTEIEFCEEQKLPHPDVWDDWRTDGYSYNLGRETGDIRCVAKPSMLTLSGHMFDMVVLDEAHAMKNRDAYRTQQFLRLQPKYRYAMTASPISNTLPDLCTLMGWTSVADWYKGGRRNASWPYSIGNQSQFTSKFMAKEVNHTKSRKHRAATGNHKTFSAPSPQVSEPCTLLKLLKPTLAYIDKKTCNPNIVPCDVVEVRVPFGNQQEALYRHYLNSKNLPAKHKGNVLVQQAFLRDVCTDPLGLSRKTKGVVFPGLVGSNLNPKLLTILDITRERLECMEQVLIVCSRIGQMDEIAKRLKECGVPYSRMDSTVNNCARESRIFKEGKTRVMLMGIQMAQGHSFANCPNLIIGSLEWTYSAKIQAMGRVWRMNSLTPVRVWCILNLNSIEEAMFDRIATKEDAATLCLYGKRQEIQRVHVDASSITAEHIIGYHKSGGVTTSETKCEQEWPILKSRIHDAIYHNPLLAA